MSVFPTPTRIETIGLPGRQSLSRHNRSITFIAIAACSALLLSGAARADWKDEIGYTALISRLGNSMPPGHTIQIAQVEMPADDDGDYLPDRSNAELSGATINELSGAGGVSNHATIVGQYCMGLMSSAGRGIRQIDSYEANNWAGAGLLMVNTNRPPRVETRPVQNHSWIGTFGTDCIDTDALRRIDLVIERDGVLVATGVKNGTGTPIPHLMCSAYNVIAVGVSNGRSSYGPTLIERTGRVKPDIVAPMAATSWATPVVASSASLLLESMETRGDFRTIASEDLRPARPLVLKALLMAGASKNPWRDWHRGFAAPASDGSVPLDYRYGAGQLDIDHSYRILEAGRQSPASAGVAAIGWDYNQVTPRVVQRYVVNVPDQKHAASVLLTWHRHISFSQDYPVALSSSLANLDLRLYRIDAAHDQLVDASRSAVDNVEHIFVRDLPAGRYALEVSSDRTWEYALAWDLDPAAPAPVKPSIPLQNPSMLADTAAVRTVSANSPAPATHLAHNGN